MYISTPPNPEVENFQNENLLPRRGSNSGPAESEADMLPSEPARRVVIQMSGNLGHICPRLSYGHHIPSKPYIIRL